jgi:hypothetical protein
MRAKMLMPALVLTSAAVFMPTRQVSGDTGFLVFGYSLDNCGDWTQARHGGYADAKVGWVAGFITGVNYARMMSGKWGGLGSKTDQAGMDAWIDNYCQQHPLEHLAKAALALVAELDGNQW